MKLGFPFSGIFASAQIAQFAAQNFFLRAIPHFLRRDTQTRLRGFARFCAQILRRKTKFCVPPQILRVFARKFCGAKQNFVAGRQIFFAGRKNIIFLLDAKVNILRGAKVKVFAATKSDIQLNLIDT